MNLESRFMTGRGMAWWIDIIFLKKRFEETTRKENGDGIFVSLMRAVRRALYDNFVDTLHHVLVVATYAYLFTNIVVFFFQQSLPASSSWLLAAFSEPYLGALGIYIVVNEIRRRRGKKLYPYLGTAATFSWFALLVTSSLLVYFGETYHLNIVYRTTVTNSFAAFIIRIGTVLGRIP